jgi:pimeloyl-ACP methyl ester carboxylesterase
MYPLAALLEKIGSAIVLTHSQAGVIGFKLADALPDLDKAHVAIEPNGLPFYDIDFKSGDDCYRDSDKIARPGAWLVFAWLTIRRPLRLRISTCRGSSRRTGRN